MKPHLLGVKIPPKIFELPPPSLLPIRFSCTSMAYLHTVNLIDSYGKCNVNVGQYTSPMDPMGY